MCVQSLGQEDPLEKEMATNSSILAWKIPWMEDPGRLQSMGSQRVGHNWATELNWTDQLYNKKQSRSISSSRTDAEPDYFIIGWILILDLSLKQPPSIIIYIDLLSYLHSFNQLRICLVVRHLRNIPIKNRAAN